MQIGGNHYEDMAIQPDEYIHKNKIGFMPGQVIKYVSRHPNKHGPDNLDDLYKARSVIDKLIKFENERINSTNNNGCTAVISDTKTF